MQKNSKIPKYIPIKSKTKIRKKTPQTSPREDFKSIKKWWGS
jgi:hypothetical protein